MRTIKYLVFTGLVLATIMACNSTQKVSYQGGSCDLLFCDLKKGTLNGLNGQASMDEVKKQLPCSTGETEEGSNFNCGGGVFYLDHTFFFYTGRNYIEIRKGYEGNMSQDVLGKAFSDIRKDLGAADNKTEHKGAYTGTITTYYEYKKAWGTLVLAVQDDVVEEVALHYGKKPGEVEFCL